MSEQDPQRERELPGNTSISHSSDEYIAGNLSQIEGEVYAVDNSEVEIDVYAPQSLGSTTNVDNYEVDVPSDPISSVGKLKGTDSALATRIRQKYIRLKKAA